MAGARIVIDLDSRRADAVLGSIETRALSDEGRTLMLEDIGEYLLRATRDRAELEVSPDGFAWPQLSPRYAARKAKLRPGAPMLKFDNHMLGDRLSHQVAGDTLYVGTSAKYGARQQFGGGGIPARPWLGVNDADAEEILQIMHDHLAAAADEASP